MISNDRNGLRRFFLIAWGKRRRGEPLSPLEHLVANVVADHPEYHAVLQNEDVALGTDFHVQPDTPNPFLHMGMHISLQEQLGADRPAGIRDLYQRLTVQSGDPHETEHRMMDCLGKVLWEAQNRGAAPDEQTYLDCLRHIASR